MPKRLELIIEAVILAALFLAYIDRISAFTKTIGKSAKAKGSEASGS